MDTWATWTTEGILSGHGGVLTEEAGIIRGELTVHTTWAHGEAVITVQYVGAAAWCTIAGSPYPAGDEATARDLHQKAVRLVQRGTAGQGSVT